MRIAGQAKVCFISVLLKHLGHDFNTDYAEARKCSQAILALPHSKMPKINLVFHAFFMGLIAFQMYRDGEGEKHLDEGKKALEKMEVWSRCSTANFINKLLLLEAEHHASMCNIAAAKAAYEASVKSARDHGLVHEQGEYSFGNIQIVYSVRLLMPRTFG